MAEKQGSPDYWEARSQLYYLLARLNTIAGNTAGLLNFDDLNSEQCEILTALTGVNANLATGSDLVNALDSIDGKVDGVLTLADLNSEQCNMLGELVGIDTALITGSDLINALDALDGTMDGKLDLTQLNSSDVKLELVKVVRNLDGTIGTLKSSIDELIGVHEDTSAFVAYGEEDWSGSAGDGFNQVLLSDINVKRNMLKIDNLGGGTITYSRIYSGVDEGQILSGSSATFHDAAGIWLGLGGINYNAHEEWAT